MCEIVLYSCASCGGGANKIVGDIFDCTFCGNTNKILNEREVISFNDKFKKPLSQNAKNILIGSFAIIGMLQYKLNKR